MTGTGPDPFVVSLMPLTQLAFRDQFVEVQDGGELAPDLRQRLERAGVLALVLVQPRVLDRHGHVRPGRPEPPRPSPKPTMRYRQVTPAPAAEEAFVSIPYTMPLAPGERANGWWRWRYRHHDQRSERAYSYLNPPEYFC